MTYYLLELNYIGIKFIVLLFLKLVMIKELYFQIFQKIYVVHLLILLDKVLNLKKCQNN